MNMGNGMARIWVVGFLSMVALLPAWGQVQVGHITYQGWDDAVELKNGDARLVVVPQISRIMYYGLSDGENILWDDAEHYGKVLPGEPFKDEEGASEWTNFGGDKVWPNQQSEFEAINGRVWPPDHYFDGGIHHVDLLEDGVVITSPLSPYNGARSTRTIRLAAHGSRVTIDQRLEKLAAADQDDLEPLRYTIWNVTQIRYPEQTLYPLNPHSALEGGLHLFNWGDTDKAMAEQKKVVAANVKIEDGIGIFKPHPVKAQKTGADSDRWLAGIVGQTAIAEFFRRDGTQMYPDGGLSAEVYTCDRYTELELLSPWVHLEIGETLDFTIEWELYAIPEQAQTPAGRRRAVVAWAQKAGK
jgi:hypothetical protein